MIGLRGLHAAARARTDRAANGRHERARGMQSAAARRNQGPVGRGGHAGTRSRRSAKRSSLADPPAGAKLSLELDASDVDGDRRDDLVARVAIEGAPPPFEAGPRVTADLRWLDWPTGLSRDPEEPEASLKRTVTAEQARVSKKNDGTSAALHR